MDQDSHAQIIKGLGLLAKFSSLPANPHPSARSPALTHLCGDAKKQYHNGIIKSSIYAVFFGNCDSVHVLS